MRGRMGNARECVDLGPDERGYGLFCGFYGDDTIERVLRVEV